MDAMCCSIRVQIQPQFHNAPPFPKTITAINLLMIIINSVQTSRHTLIPGKGINIKAFSATHHKVWYFITLEMNYYYNIYKSHVQSIRHCNIVYSETGLIVNQKPEDNCNKKDSKVLTVNRSLKHVRECIKYQSQSFSASEPLNWILTQIPHVVNISLWAFMCIPQHWAV